MTSQPPPQMPPSLPLALSALHMINSSPSLTKHVVCNPTACVVVLFQEDIIFYLYTIIYLGTTSPHVEDFRD